MNDATLAYHQVEALIHKVVHEFVKTYHCDYEEARSEANLHFMNAWRTYDSDKGAFSTWVYNKVWWGLVESLRERLRKANIKINQEVWEKTHQERTDLYTLLKDLSSDANAIVYVVLNVNEKKPENMLSFLIHELLSRDWSCFRIDKAIREIKEALR